MTVGMAPPGLLPPGVAFLEQHPAVLLPLLRVRPEGLRAQPLHLGARVSETALERGVDLHHRLCIGRLYHQGRGVELEDASEAAQRTVALVLQLLERADVLEEHHRTHRLPGVAAQRGRAGQ